MFGTFRPWGPAEWLFPKLQVNDWLLLGSVSTEDRCTSVLHHVPIGNGATEARFLEIEDLPFELTESCQARRKVNRAIFEQLTGAHGIISEFGLLDSPKKIKQFVNAATADGFRNIVVDISTLPKRFFFPIIKLLSKEPLIDNLVATYSTPEKYCGENLAFEPQSWSYLPMFQREDAPPGNKCIRVIVGVGFLPFRLPELLKHDYQDAEVTLILPFPPGPPQFQRNWQFVHEIEKTCPLKDDRQILRVDAYDTAGCFEHLSSLAHEAPERTVLAPFGPKSHSLAMCLFAIKYDCDVYYTQPKHYHPEYSTGIKKTKSGEPETFAYAIKLDGRPLY